MGAKLEKGVNDFASQKGFAAKYWSDKNKLRPDEVFAESNKKFWFEAYAPGNNGEDIWYEFEYSPNKIKSENGFPAHKDARCKLIPGFNDLASKYPDLVDQFVSCEGETDPSLVKFRGKIKCVWVCTKGHRREMTMGSKFVSGNGCAVCANRVIGEGSRTALSEHPELGLDGVWSDKNEIGPDEVAYSSGKKFYINCIEHDYHISMSNYHRGTRCGKCNGRVVENGGMNSLSFERPDLVSEYMDKNPIPVDQIHYGSPKKVWWKHCCGYEWEALVYNRSGNGRKGCPRCNSGWSAEALLEALSKLKDMVKYMTADERLVLMQGKGIPVNGGSLNSSAVNKWVRGKIDFNELTETLSSGDPVDSDVSAEEGEEEEELDAVDVLDGEMRILNVPEVFKCIEALDSSFSSSSTEEDVVKYFEAKYLGHLWNNVWNGHDVANAVKKWGVEGDFAEQIKAKFLSEFNETMSDEVPAGWPYPFAPNMMQKYVAMRMRRDGRMGNWSGTGSGKTASAILSWLVAAADQEVIVLCPNAVVDGWKENVKGFSGWHIFNYEKLSTDRGVKELDRLVKSGKIGMVVIDEIHYTKFRGGADKAASSKRRMASERLLGDLGRDVKVLGMSATPVINDLSEGASIIDLVCGVKSGLGTTVSLSNIAALHQNFVQHGIRYMPNYKESMNLVVEQPIIETTVADFADYGDSVLALEQRSVELKMEEIVKAVMNGGIIYTHYTTGIVGPIKLACEKAGLKVGVYTGTDKSGLQMYLNDEVDVLIGSSSIGTGIDGLQHKHGVMVFASLPWTDAEFQQTVGRIFRQGRKGDVKVVIPQTSDWCVSRMKLIESKRTLAKAVMEGNLPDVQITEDRVVGTIETMIQKIRDEGVTTIDRDGLDTDLISLVTGENVKHGQTELSDFSKTNQNWNITHSKTLHARLQESNEKWEDYQDQYESARETWEFVPYKHFEKLLKTRKGKLVADMGCGRTLMDVGDNEVIRFDHSKTDGEEGVIICDISDVSAYLPDGSVDIVVFSLSLMGSNWRDYLDEASRIVDVDGHIWIAETINRDENHNLEQEIVDRDWTVLSREEHGQFVVYRLAK